MADKSILQKARDEGRDKAEARYAYFAAQMSQANYDDAYDKGQQFAYVQAPSRFKWWAFGVLVGAIMSAWGGTFI